MDNLFPRRDLLAFFAVLIATLLVSCRFNSPFVSGDEPCSACSYFEDAPVKDLTDSDHGTNPPLFDDGTIYAYQGFGCAESNKSGTQDIIKVEGNKDIPVYATNATVFLNGWHLSYLHGDHHVSGIATVIRNIKIEDKPDNTGKTLKWEAIGAIGDTDFEVAYKWCYYYTVVAWNPSNINLTVEHAVETCCSIPNETREANFFFVKNDGTTTALSSFPSFLGNPSFATSKAVAILPRGFGFNWNGFNLVFGNDHHLLQIGYNLDHSEIFFESGKKYYKGLGDTTRDHDLPTLVDSVPPEPGHVSWDTYGIFKDNDTRRDYQFGSMVSGLGGNDVEVVEPPFSILPIESDFFCGSQRGAGTRTQEFVIENVPYEYAIPMLTGWELGYLCSDQHVAEIGVWIDEMDYDKASRKLHYKLVSVLHDEDNDPDFFNSHKVTILGLKPAVITSQHVPDLVPFSPLGTDPTAFCRIEQDRKLLRVTIKNQGNADAGASKTTVIFGNTNTSVTLDTPPIPAGKSVDLLFNVPSGCFSPDCSFKITVDSNNQVNELNNEGNNTANGGCIG